MTQAIFLSYSSDDADAARRICESLRAAGLEVWFDQSELRGGDAWDASIRKQIKECALFVPMISASTNARSEGYFRLEWKLAVDRSHLMADDQTFFLPVILDDTPEPSARVPDKFRERQWTRLKEESAVSAFAARIVKLIAGSGVSGRSASNTAPNGEFADSVGWAKRSVPTNPDATTAMSPNSPSETRGHAALCPPYTSSHASSDTPSIAVLAFANRSASADDEYFSDGLADELLNVLARIKGLRVAARTSAFSFKGKSTTIAEIGRMLNVATVLEGSVRKSGNRIRVAVQLVKVSDGYQLWSESFDRTMDDIFAVQDDIAQAVVKELRTVLMHEDGGAGLDAAISAQVAQVAAGRTNNAQAHALFLHGRFLIRRFAPSDLLSGIQCLRDALGNDGGYAEAWAWLSFGLSRAAGYGMLSMQDANSEALTAAERALALDPNSVAGLVALFVHENFWGWNWPRALEAAEQALRIAPDDADVCVSASLLMLSVGNLARALTLAQTGVLRDPLNAEAHACVGRVLDALERPATEVEAAYRTALEISPQGVSYNSFLAMALSEQGRHDEALQICALERSASFRLEGQAFIHFRAGHLSEANEVLDKLLELESKRGSTSSIAYQLACVYAYRSDADHAFEWMEVGYTERDAGIVLVKTSRFFRKLRSDPRWPVFMRKMGHSD